MVSLISTLQRAINTMNNAIDDVGYIINLSDFILIFQKVKITSYSHSIVAGGLLDTS